MEVGELARAAEALERAAAAEEEIARQLVAPEIAAMLTAEFSAALYRENADAAGVAVSEADAELLHEAQAMMRGGYLEILRLGAAE